STNLVGKDRGERIITLSIALIPKGGIRYCLAQGTSEGTSLKKIIGPGFMWGNQVRRFGSVNHVRQKRDCQQRMSVEHTMRAANHSLAVSGGIPSKTSSRRPVIGVSWNTLCDAKQIFTRL